MEISKAKIAIIGLGYVGLPLARLFASKYPTIGFDRDAARVEALQKSIDTTEAVARTQPAKDAAPRQLQYTDKVEDIKDCNFYIVTVPTPVDKDNHPDLTPLIEASSSIGKVITVGDVVVYESTVYPGATEEDCIPVIEKVSGLQFNKDFYAGYSPERINPGDREHTVEKIKKVTSGSTPEIAEYIDALYRSVLVNGTYKAPSIRVAEASKIVENAQRDVNIAFMNEVAKMFDTMGIDTHQVLEAASTKWNFLPFHPGLVGGHCIGVDSYYLIEKSLRHGYQPRLLMEARAVNNSMGVYYATELIRQMILAGLPVKDAKILILGFAFKPNCADIRNTKVVDIYNTLLSYGVAQIAVCDPFVSPKEAYSMYGIEIANTIPSSFEEYDVVFLAVAHAPFLSISREKASEVKYFFLQLPHPATLNPEIVKKTP